MRRILVSAVFAALVLAGCGSSSSSSSSPLNTELSYLPSGSPAVVVFATDPNGTAWQNASGFVAKFPLAQLGLSALESDLAKSGVNYNQDIKPLLGNPVTLGITTTTSASSKGFVIVLIAKNASNLNVLTRGQSAPTSASKYEGANLYQGSSYCLAIDGNTALLGPSLTEIKSALHLHAHGGGVNPNDFNDALNGLSQNPLVQVYGNLAGVLSGPHAAQARQIPWVAAIKSYGLTLSLADTGVDVRYRVNTSGPTLTSSELPLPTGSEAPSVVGQAPVVVGIRDLAQTFTFIEGAVQAVNPKALASAMNQVAKNGIQLNRDLISQFTGNSELDYGPAGLRARFDLANPAQAVTTLAKLKHLKRVGRGFYEVTNTKNPALIGIFKGRLVIGRTSRAALRAFASASASPISGASGPLAAQVSVGSLVSLIAAATHSASSLPPQVGQLLGAFGPLVSWTANDSSGLYGEISLPLK
jgi:uncharacterized protein DUF3352